MCGASRFRPVLGEDPNFAVKAGRYNLFTALNCPWFHHVKLACIILGLQNSITMDVEFPSCMTDDDLIEPNRSEFNPTRIVTLNIVTLPECTAETATGLSLRYAKQIYEAEGSDKASVPILYNEKTKQIVANKSTTKN